MVNKMKKLISTLVIAVSLFASAPVFAGENDYIAGGYAASDALEWADSPGMHGATVIGCKYIGDGAQAKCVLAKALDADRTDTVSLYCNGNVKIGNRCVQTGFTRFVKG